MLGMYRDRSPSLAVVVPLIVVAALAAAGWWLVAGRGDGAASPAAPAGPAAEATPFLLPAGQLGSGFVPRPGGTGTTTVSEIHSLGTASAEAVVTRSWTAGAAAAYGQQNGTLSVETRAEVFGTEALGPVLTAFRDGLVRRYIGSTQVAPPGVPGDEAWLITGSTAADAGSVAVVLWRHGTVVAMVTVTGAPSDGVPQRAVELAGLQDAAIASALR